MNCKHKPRRISSILLSAVLLCGVLLPALSTAQDEDRDITTFTTPTIDKIDQCHRKKTYTDPTGTEQIKTHKKFVTEEETLDKSTNKIVWQKTVSVDSIYYKDGRRLIVKRIQNCAGIHTYDEIIKRDAGGKVTYYMQLMYDKTGYGIEKTTTVEIKNGVQITDVTKTGEPSKHHEQTINKSDPPFEVSYTEDNLAICPCPRRSNEWFIGGSTVFEDSYKRFNTYGVNIAYSHSVSEQIGITGDGGIYFGSQSGIDFTKIQVLAGISLLAGNNTGNKHLFSPHLLAGIANVRSKYSSSSTSSSAFSVAAGTDINIGRSLALRGDYNPAFRSGGTAHNFRLSAGLKIH